MIKKSKNYLRANRVLRIKNLERTIIRFDNKGQKPCQIKRLKKSIYRQLDGVSPKYLYTFRPFEEKHIDSLRDDKLYLSIPANFNDPTESMAYVDPSKAVNYAMGIPSEWFEGNGDDDESVDPNNIIERLDIMNLCIGYIDAIRHRIKVGCLSEDINSTLMWSHYANEHTGFAIRYKVQDIAIPECKECSIAKACYCRRPGKPLFPVIYKRDRYDASAIAFARSLYIKKDLKMEQFPTVDDFPVPLLSVIQKQKNWSYEYEWRLICFNKSINCFSIKPDAIYLGENISCEHALTLAEIAKEKNIPLYKMSINYLSSEFPLSYDEWSNYTEEIIREKVEERRKGYGARSIGVCVVD